MKTIYSTSIYSYRINKFGSPVKWTNVGLFTSLTNNNNLSAIDSFYGKLKEINNLTLDSRNLTPFINKLFEDKTISKKANTKLLEYLKDTTTINPIQANLILLGYISAVESYVREIIRKVIIADDITRKKCESIDILFGSALYHETSLLPETLLESKSFIKRETFENVLSELIGIPKDSIPSSLISVLQEYENLCHLRHCIIHRFGKLGANNAIKLGLESHKDYIEKSITLNYLSLDMAAQISLNLVLELNQFLWQNIMMRQIAELQVPQKGIWKKIISYNNWTWNFVKDKQKFKIFYDIFASSVFNPSIKDAYNKYRETFKNLQPK